MNRRAIRDMMSRGNTGCGNIASFFILRGNQAVEVSSSGVGVFSFYRRDSKVSMEIQSVAIRRWSSEERAFVIEVYFSNRLSVIQPSTFPNISM